MHTVAVLHKLLLQSVPAMHATRLNTLMAAVQTLTQGAKASVTSLGRGLAGSVYDKHKIKRMDRLLSNQHLQQETQAIYGALTKQLLNERWVSSFFSIREVEQGPDGAVWVLEDRDGGRLLKLTPKKGRIQLISQDH